MKFIKSIFSRILSSICIVAVFALSSLFPLHSNSAIKQNTVENYLQKSKAEGKTSNRLISETSPYLLQHAYNPVKWYPWGEEAFEKAKAENKPVFLSIGYSTCHWCHVMARESFENDVIAAIMNKNFINIKVDREERPDVDNIYMSATQLISGSGGWPMSVFLNHDKEPFFAGTYFPPETVGDYRGMTDLLKEINRLWLEERPRVELIADNVTQQIAAEADESGTGEEFNSFNTLIALQQISSSYDDSFGGFSNAPKFPRVDIYTLLLKIAESKKEGSEKAHEMLEKTLVSMARGGIFDQVGGGFHRYSVDAQWQVPHFEKMLYSQALMATVYLRFYELDKKPLYLETAQSILNFVLREMTSPQGGFYSALNADSEKPDKAGEHAEGAFYLWSKKELLSLLSKNEFNFIQAYYNIDENGNIDSDPQGEFTNLNHLYVSEEFVGENLSKQQQMLLHSVKNKLLQKRYNRPRPHLDDKIITAWNGMMISAFSKAYDVTKNKKYLDAADRGMVFLRDYLIEKKTTQLYRRIRAGNAGIDAGLNDYVWAVKALIDLYKVSDNKTWLDLAIQLNQKQNTLFLDKAIGGYFDSAIVDSGLVDSHNKSKSSSSSLLFRSKTIYDGAIPAANSIALLNLFELYEITKQKKWKLKADELIAAFAGVMNNNPASTSMALGVMQ